MPKTLHVILGATSLEITQDPTGTNNVELYPKGSVLGVVPVKLNSQPAGIDAENWKYPYPTMTVVEVVMHDEKRFNFELQDVSNQAGWSTGNQAGIDACIADFNAWLP